MTPESQTLLRAPFDPSEVGKLPRITCKACRDSNTKACQEHRKAECKVCGNFITPRHIHLDYVGHAELTDRLLDVDPEWSWEPVGWTDEGMPVIAKHGPNYVMWGRLTLCGTTRLGVGTAPATKEDVHKELIGDFLRNAAMRFGVALDLWRKSEKAEAEAEHAEPAPSEPDHAAPATGAFMARINALPGPVQVKARRAKPESVPWPVPDEVDDDMSNAIDEWLRPFEETRA